ncbi:hypothetical protein VPH35_139722 [Triticum aestivum]|uniref:uncharacterized protein n=1 Tax=Triticum aestivum TaxID=4565 RepID=UPI001D01F60C|nr:uncharacterized protein LOC123164758 [Triticum aestivum]
MATTCTVLNGAVRAVKLLKIDSFRLAYKTMREGEFLRTSWNVDGHDVEIRWYPGTAWAPHELMFLTCNVRASFGCLLVHPRLPNKSNEEKTIRSAGSDFTPRRLLDRPVHRHDFEGELAYTTTTVPAPASNMHQHFRELLQNGTGADVTFLVSGKTFAAHKLVPAARSPVFMAEFFGDMKEKSSWIVEIKDMEAAVFGALLEFIYTDNVPELDRELEAVATMAQHLLAAADRYGLDRLKIICEGKLVGGISASPSRRRRLLWLWLSSTIVRTSRGSALSLSSVLLRSLMPWWRRRGISIRRQAALLRSLALSCACLRVGEGTEALLVG